LGEKLQKIKKEEIEKEENTRETITGSEELGAEMENKNPQEPKPTPSNLHRSHHSP
jgi:hypothetical protein